MSNYGCNGYKNNHLKRKHEQIPGSPSGVIDAYFSSESSNDSWAASSSVSSESSNDSWTASSSVSSESSNDSWAASSSVSSSPEPQFKKIKAEASSLNRLMGIVGSP